MVLCQSQLPRAAFMQTANCFKCTRQFNWHRGNTGGKEGGGKQKVRRVGALGKGLLNCVFWLQVTNASVRLTAGSTLSHCHAWLPRPPPSSAPPIPLPHLAKWFVSVYPHWYALFRAVSLALGLPSGWLHSASLSTTWQQIVCVCGVYVCPALAQPHSLTYSLPLSLSLSPACHCLLTLSKVICMLANRLHNWTIRQGILQFVTSNLNTQCAGGICAASTKWNLHKICE